MAGLLTSRYDPNLEVKFLEAFFGIVERDEFGCFLAKVKCQLSPGFVTKAVDKVMNKS